MSHYCTNSFNSLQGVTCDISNDAPSPETLWSEAHVNGGSYDRTQELLGPEGYRISPKSRVSLARTEERLVSRKDMFSIKYRSSSLLSVSHSDHHEGTRNGVTQPSTTRKLTDIPVHNRRLRSNDRLLVEVGRLFVQQIGVPARRLNREHPGI